MMQTSQMAQYSSIKRTFDFEDSEDDLFESDLVSPYYSDGLNYAGNISREMSISQKYVLPRNIESTAKTLQNTKPLKSSNAFIKFSLICAALFLSIYLLKNPFNPLKIIKVPNKTWKQLESINKELLDWYKGYSEAYKGEFSEAEFLELLKDKNSKIMTIVSNTCEVTDSESDNESLSEFRKNIYDRIVQPHMKKVNWAAYQECYKALNHLASIGVKHDPSLYGRFEGFNTLSFFGKSPFKVKTIYPSSIRDNFVDVGDVKERLNGLVNILDRAERLLARPYHTFFQYTEMYATDDQSEIEERIKQFEKKV